MGCEIGSMCQTKSSKHLSKRLTIFEPLVVKRDQAKVSMPCVVA